MEDDEPKSPSLPEDSQLHQYSERLAENVEGFQQFIDQVIEAIKDDASFNGMTEESYEQKKSTMKSHFLELLNIHNSLADEFGDFIEQVNKHCLSLGQNLQFSTSTGFDVNLQSGGGFYLSTGKGLEDLEQEVLSLKQQLQSLTVENGELKMEIEENIEDIKVYMSESKLELETKEQQLKAAQETVMQIDEHMSGVLVGMLAKQSNHDSEIKIVNMQISQMKATHDKEKKIWNDVKRQLQDDLKEKCELVEQLSSHMNILVADKSSQNNIIHELKTELHSLKYENVGVLPSFDNVQKLTDELKQKVVELESEVDKQREAIVNRE